MGKKFYQNEKFQEIFYPVLYIILSISMVVSGLVIFYNTYYTPIYVHGSSMMPTLLGAYTSKRVHYGIADKHVSSVERLRRFDVCITYYPATWNGGDEDTVFKIKRVWGFPGETIELTKTDTEYTFNVYRTNNDIKPFESYVAPISEKTFNLDGFVTNLTVATFTNPDKSFNVNITDTSRVFKTTLDYVNQEYFLMGDNWKSSSDSFSHLGMDERITKSLVQGKVTCIQGTAVYNSAKKTLIEKKRIKDMYYF